MRALVISLVIALAACGEDSRSVDGDGNYQPTAGRWVVEYDACGEVHELAGSWWYVTSPFDENDRLVRHDFESTIGESCDVMPPEGFGAFVVCRTNGGAPSVSIELLDDEDGARAVRWGVSVDGCSDNGPVDATVLEREQW
jgi:hypothetical protein